MGVLSLVCLSCSVIWGLVAQDRILLGPRQRILAQAVHRTTAVASIAFLLVHIGIKLALDHTTWIAAIIPSGWPSRTTRPSPAGPSSSGSAPSPAC
ncbi:hypothetical protein GCM10023238_28240 [Streptomyces heliomycini]